jgi:transposase-like protein
MTIHERIAELARDMAREAVPIMEATELFRDRCAAAAIEHCDGNITRAARRLGVHRNTVMLWRRAWRQGETRRKGRG